MHHAQPGGNGIARTMKVRRLTIDENCALVLVRQTEKHIHQGRFAGAVFPEERVNLPLTDTQIDAVIGDDARKPLDDAEHLDRHFRLGDWRSFWLSHPRCFSAASDRPRQTW